NIFFFSSRRRHTRSKRDWSSDVCSSDLSNKRTSYKCHADAIKNGSTSRSFIDTRCSNRPGVWRQEGVHSRQRNRHRKTHPQQVRVGSPNKRKSDRNDDNEGGFVEHRDTDNHRCSNHRPLDMLFTTDINNLKRDPLSSTGITGNTTNHCAEPDDNQCVCKLPAEACGNNVWNRIDTDRLPLNCDPARSCTP